MIPTNVARSKATQESTMSWIENPCRTGLTPLQTVHLGCKSDGHAGEVCESLGEEREARAACLVEHLCEQPERRGFLIYSSVSCGVGGHILGPNALSPLLSM